MRYMLDTDICIALIKRRPPNVLARFHSLTVGDLGISSITLAELKYGVARSQAVEKNAQALDQFLLPLEIADFDELAASCYGPVRAELEMAGTPIGPLDTQIGAHALSLDITLVTANIKEFCRIKQLRIENWLE
jgi:tRNA(fMet)-specific endonuclease VapC